MTSTIGLFFSAATHSEALAQLLARSLEARHGYSAFLFADRRCRRGRPTAQDRLARAQGLKLMGHIDAALEDLAEAMRQDPTENAVNLALLTWGPESERDAAAERILQADSAPPDLLRSAIAHLLASGRPLVHRLRVLEARELSGWAVWSADAPLRIEAVGARANREFAPDPAHTFASLGSAADIRIPTAAADFLALQIGEREIASLAAYPEAPRIAPSEAGAKATAPDRVQVVVPVYADLEATRACLQSLARQSASVAIRPLVVDDASPEPELRAYLDACAAHGEIELVRNARNLGFVGAVNEAFRRCDGGDVLLLNADAVLPPGAIERLRRAAYSAPDIGAAAPFSNHSEFTSYPIPFQENPLPAPAEIERLDAIFQTSNAGGTVTIPVGTGFCLYIPRDAFERVGALSTLYAPGYNEDSEWALQARALGLRVVCAADVFAGHAGSRSFRAAKRALVMRNNRILHERHPTHSAEVVAFLNADPLRSARARVERDDPPKAVTRLLVVASPRAADFAARRAHSVAVAEPRSNPIVVARGAGETWTFHGERTAPQSLAFDLAAPEEREAMTRYLAALKLDRIEIFAVDQLPSELEYALAALDAPIDVYCSDGWQIGPLIPASGARCGGDPEEGPCAACASAAQALPDAGRRTVAIANALRRLTSPDSRLLASDAMAEAFAAQVLGPSFPPAAARVRERSPRRESLARRLVVLVPTASAEADRLLIELGRTFASLGAPAEIVVLGGCLDDLAVMSAGTVFVTGPMKIDEYRRSLSLYDPGLLLLPYRASRYWMFDEIGESDLPRAYFDWSFGRMPPCDGDLALDPRLCDAKAARALARWTMTRLGLGAPAAAS